MSPLQGFVPPPYPHDRLDALKEIARAVPGGIVDCSIGTPVDPMPEVAVRALVDAASGATGYPATIGSVPYREAAAAWIARRFGCTVTEGEVVACIGTKELVASLPRALSLRDPSRDMVLYPAASYPTYEMGATLAGLRAVPVPLDERWHLDLSRVPDRRRRSRPRAVAQRPVEPHRCHRHPDRDGRIGRLGTRAGHHRGERRVLRGVHSDETGSPTAPITALAAGLEGVLAVHSLSKRSNMAGLRAGFVAGDRELVTYLGEIRKHGGLMTPAPVQAAAAAALGDDDHVHEQRTRYAKRRAVALSALETRDLVHDGGPSTFYLWLRAADGPSDGWSIAADLAKTGLLVAPGDFYGDAGTSHVRLALTVTDDQLALACERLTA